MKIEAHQYYHVYNRGNQQQPIFFTEENYQFFLRKVEKHLVPVCDIITYCLMPNHFHFLIRTDERTSAIISINPREITTTAFSRATRILLSSYTRAIQRQEGFTGSLFQQKTKAKIVSGSLSEECYLTTCIRYILFNPVAAGLVEEVGDWPFNNFSVLINESEDAITSLRYLQQDLDRIRESGHLVDWLCIPVKEEEQPLIF